MEFLKKIVKILIQAFVLSILTISILMALNFIGLINILKQ